LVADLDDTQGDTTREEIHIGAMAGTVDLVLRTFAGLRVGTDTVVLDPRLPDGLRRARFLVRYRGQRIEVSVAHDRLWLSVHPCVAAPVRVTVAGTPVTVAGGETREVALQR
jgi:trehalose/maltose hydrolase-like predicted phosphorylase